MENASKALIMAGSILIALMIIAVGVYIFQRGQAAAGQTTNSATSSSVDNFNAKFSIYETKDITSISSTDDEDDARKELNTVSDVVSAVNAAYDVNYENNSGYKYSYLETDNAVEIIVDLGTSKPSQFSYRYYLLEPNADVSEGMIYGQSSLASSRTSRIIGFSTSNSESLNNFLLYLNESEYKNDYTYYKYYFKGECSYNYDDTEESGKINSVKFTMVVNSKFGT